ncbi:fibrinogen C domain-containing protein 1-like isoform X2 [Macrobrachium rosenbergii]|uniref:fibrinogen C domain-containing protein 1-like isoform X2 n=1 Tax=Macrobrachium rosenbergii TaxID=79674 RepID=UPI0034D56538
MRLVLLLLSCLLWVASSSVAQETDPPETEAEVKPRERERGRGKGKGRNRDMRPLIRPRQEVVNALESDPGKYGGTDFLSIHTASHSELAASAAAASGLPGIPDGGSGAAESEISRRQMDTIILLLQRLSDRLASLETIQNQRGERLDTVHYRLTRLELQAEERKSLLNELSTSIRHRMDTTDSERDRVGESLDELKTNIKTLEQQGTQLRTVVDSISTKEGREDTGTTPKLQAAMASLYGLHSMTQNLKQEVAEISQNMSALANITSQINQLQEGLVTKQYLKQSLNEMRSQRQSLSFSAPQPRARQGQSNKEPEDCWKILQKGKKKSGVYRIQPIYSTVPFFVYCDMETDGGGWTVIQRREDGAVDFLREWSDYKYGFGNLAGEFWLGNEQIHLLTNQHVSQLRIDIADFDQLEAHADYSAFAMGSELEGYSLKMLGQYTGDAGDSLRYHVGRRFSTIDVDNDAWPEANCARDHAGAWWYRACDTSNLNGRYLHGPVPPDHEYTGLYWYDFRGPLYSLWRSRMMIRRGGHVGEPIFKDLKQLQKSMTTPSPNMTEPRPTRRDEIPDPRGHPDEGFYNPEHDPYASYDYPYDPYG